MRLVFTCIPTTAKMKNSMRMSSATYGRACSTSAGREHHHHTCWLKRLAWAGGLYSPEGTWWRSTEDSESPQSDSEASLDAWPERVWRMWWTRSCSPRTFWEQGQREQLSVPALECQQNLKHKAKATHCNGLHRVNILQKERKKKTKTMFSAGQINLKQKQKWRVTAQPWRQ